MRLTRDIKKKKSYEAGTSTRTIFVNAPVVGWPMVSSISVTLHLSNKIFLIINTSSLRHGTWNASGQLACIFALFLYKTCLPNYGNWSSETDFFETQRRAVPVLFVGSGISVLLPAWFFFSPHSGYVVLSESPRAVNWNVDRFESVLRPLFVHAACNSFSHPRYFLSLFSPFSLLRPAAYDHCLSLSRYACLLDHHHISHSIINEGFAGLYDRRFPLSSCFQAFFCMLSKLSITTRRQHQAHSIIITIITIIINMKHC